MRLLQPLLFSKSVTAFFGCIAWTVQLTAKEKKKNFWKVSWFRPQSFFATDVAHSRRNTNDPGMAATLTLVSTRYCSVANLHLQKSEVGVTVEWKIRECLNLRLHWNRKCVADCWMQDMMRGRESQTHWHLNKVKVQRKNCKSILGQTPPCNPGLAKKIMSLRYLEELICWLNMRLNFTKKKKRASVQRAASAALWLPMVLSHQGYQLKSTSTPSRGTPYVSRCAAVLTRDSTCCAQLLLCVLWLQESFSHTALWVAVQLRRSQHRPIHFKGQWFWDQDRPSQDWVWVMTKIARSNIHSHELVNTRHWKPVWDGLISTQSSMKDWTNEKMGNGKKWICNVPCLGIVRSLTGGSSHPSWLRLLFGVSSVLSAPG